MSLNKSRFITVLSSAFLIPLLPVLCWAATTVPFTVTMSEAVNVNTGSGTPRIAINVGGITRYASYSAGTGTSTLTFTYSAQAGDLDLDGVTLSSPVELNGGAITDLNGNPETDLTFSVPNTSGIKVDYPSLSMDFRADADGRYALNGTAYNDLASFITATGGSFTRSSTATYFDSSGDLQVASNDVPRIDYNPVALTPRGILIEQSRTNTIKNSEMVGASVGVLPTGWGKQNVSGLTLDVVGTGTENNMKYVDVQVSGTPTATGSIAIFFTSNLDVPSVNGDTWSLTSYIKLSGGSLTNISFPLIAIQIYNSGGSYLGGIGSSTTISPTSAALHTTRWRLTGTVSNASTSYVRPFMSANITSGMPVNATFRIAAPQLEKTPFPSSYIPTTGSTAARAADNFTIPTGAWTGSSKGTLFANAIIPYVGGSGYPGSVALNDGTANNAVECVINDASTDSRATNIFIGGVGIYGASQAGYTPGSPFKCAMAYEVNNVRGSIDGTNGAVNTSISVPPINSLSIGTNRGTPSKLYGWVNEIKYYPVRVPDTQLQLLTQ